MKYNKEPVIKNKNATTENTALSNAITVNISRFDDSFFGVGYVGSKRYVVPGALPKEKLEIKPQKTFNNINYASIVKIIEQSPDREKPVCNYYHSCGGCNMMHLNYKASVEAKVSHLKKKLAGISADISEAVCLSEFGNRNKVHIVFSKEAKRLNIGFFNEETHKVVDVPSCMMHGQWYSELVKILRRWIVKRNISIYNPITREGVLRFAVARKLENALQLTLVVTATELEGLEGLFTDLQSIFGNISLWLNHNGERTNEVFAGKFIHLMGEEKIYGEMLGIKFALSPNSFFQVNNKVAAEIYKDILSIVKASGAKYVIDAFSGIGITSALFAKEGLQVSAIEIVKEAVADQNTIAKINSVENNIKSLCGDIAEILPTLSIPQEAALFVDPPRKGLGEDVIKAVLKLAPPTILYLSCNPETLAADLALLTKDRYAVSLVKPYDMFPRTKHLETLVCLTRNRT